jgi:hypothetical protein
LRDRFLTEFQFENSFKFEFQPSPVMKQIPILPSQGTHKPFGCRYMVLVVNNNPIFWKKNNWLEIPHRITRNYYCVEIPYPREFTEKIREKCIFFEIASVRNLNFHFMHSYNAEENVAGKSNSVGN